MKHVFISYMNEDKEIVKSLCNDLDGMGVTIWKDKDNILPGEEWSPAIREAIQSASFFLICFSDTYMRKKETYMNKEIEFAASHFVEDTANRIIPLRLSEKVVIPDMQLAGGKTLNKIQWVDFYDKNRDDGLLNLFRLLQPENPFKRSRFILEKIKDSRELRLALDELELLGKRQPELTKKIIEIVTGFIRIRSPWRPHAINDSVDELVQHALTVLATVPRIDQNGNLIRIDLHNVDLSHADLQDMDFKKAEFWGSNFNNAILSRGNFSMTDMGGCDFTDASLEMTDLTGAYLWCSAPCEPNRPCIFRRTVLYGTIFQNTNLSGAVFDDVRGLTKSQTESAIINEHTQLPFAMA